MCKYCEKELNTLILFLRSFPTKPIFEDLMDLGVLGEHKILVRIDEDCENTPCLFLELYQPFSRIRACHSNIQINYCPMCGRKLRESKWKKEKQDMKN